MKVFTLLIAGLAFQGVFGQSTELIEGNNIRALIVDDGYFFYDRDNNLSALEFPKDSGTYPLFGMNYWMGGKDVNDQLHLAAQIKPYEGSQDYFPGPIANNYNSDYYLDNFSSSIWKIDRDQINYHVTNYLENNYVMDSAIENWPGNGNISEGIAPQLAPYVDVNNNATYDPENGDYPYIQGDFAVFTIMNDAAGIHTASGGEPIGVEVHSMFYGFETDDDLNNTLFLNVKLFNRSNQDYVDFSHTIWVDPTLYNGTSEYLGCDTLRNLGYAYSSKAPNSFTPDHMSIGTVYLNKQMDVFMWHDNSGGIISQPNNSNQFYNLMNANWLNNVPLTYGGLGLFGTIPTNYCFSGDPVTNTGWSEYGLQEPASYYKRYLSSVKFDDFQAQTEKCIDVAFVFNDDTADHVLNVANLFQSVDFVQDYYDNNIQPCSQIFLGDNKHEFQALDIKLYPNPANSEISIESNSSFRYEIMSINGTSIISGYSESHIAQLKLELSPGIYLVKIDDTQGTKIEKLIVE